MKAKACLGFGVEMSDNVKNVLNETKAKKTKIKKREKASWSKSNKKWNEELADDLHKPVKRKFQRRQVSVNEIDDVWAADLVEMQEWKSVNKGFRYILNVIDCFSKYAWSVPLKDKTSKTVLHAFQHIG